MEGVIRSVGVLDSEPPCGKCSRSITGLDQSCFEHCFGWCVEEALVWSRTAYLVQEGTRSVSTLLASVAAYVRGVRDDGVPRSINPVAFGVWTHRKATHTAPIMRARLRAQAQLLV
jgi:hypothetical protein